MAAARAAELVYRPSRLPKARRRGSQGGRDMTANDRPMDVLWIEVPATSSAEDLARVIDEFPPGTEGRYYLVHMDLIAGRVDFADTLTQRGYQVNISDILR